MDYDGFNMSNFTHFTVYNIHKMVLIFCHSIVSVSDITHVVYSVLLCTTVSASLYSQEYVTTTLTFYGIGTPFVNPLKKF